MRRLTVTAQRDEQLKEPLGFCSVQRMLGGKGDRRETVDVLQGRRTIKPAWLWIKAARPAMDATLLIADNDVRRRRELRRFFFGSGFLVAAASDGLGCLAEIVALEPDVLVIALDLPWGGGDGVIARLNDGLRVRRKPLILVMGDASPEVLSVRTGVAPCNCFPMPVRKGELLDRIGMELGIRLLRAAEAKQWPSEVTMTQTLLEDGVR